MGSISGMQWFSIYGSVNVTYHINKLKNKNYIITPIDREKGFEKAQIIYFSIPVLLSAIHEW